jgi:hypothetical protein
MYKIILSALSLLALSGCGQPYQSYGFTPRDFSKEKAVVVMSIKGDASYSLLTQGLILEVIKFANDDGSYFPLMDENNYYTHDYHIHKHIFSKNILVMLIDPGYYSFNKIHLEVGNTIYFSPQKVRAVMDTNSKETFLLPYGGFYAKKGTVS